MTEEHTLVLLRHAKAAPADELGDSRRVLTSGGRQQSADIGAVLAERVGEPDVVLVSAALRTTETAEIVATALPGSPSLEIRDELYGAGAREVLELLAELDEGVRRVLVVGHEPTMSSLAALLGGTRDPLASQVSFGIGTANAVVIELPAWTGLDRGSGRLRAVLHPQ